MKYTEHYTITSHDVDIHNHIRPSLLLRYMQETANHQMRDRRPTYYELFDEGKSFIVTRINIEIFHQLQMYDEIQVQTWRCPSKGATFIRCFAVLRDGKLMAKAYSTWAVANLNTGKLCKVTEVNLDNYEVEEPHTMALPDRFRLPKDIDYVSAGERYIGYSQVDMNLHMNNTYYPDMLWERIPGIEEKMVTSLSLRFMKEAALGAAVKIYRSKLPQPLAEDGQAEETWCFYSLVDEEINVEAQIGTKSL